MFSLWSHLETEWTLILTRAGTTSFTGAEEEYRWALLAANFSVGIDFPAILSLRPSTCLQTEPPDPECFITPCDDCRTSKRNGSLHHTPEYLSHIFSKFDHFFLWQHAEDGGFLKCIGGLQEKSSQHVAGDKNALECFCTFAAGQREKRWYSSPGTTCSLCRAGQRTDTPPSSSVRMSRPTSAPSNTGGESAATLPVLQCMPGTFPVPAKRIQTHAFFFFSSTPTQT